MIFNLLNKKKQTNENTNLIKIIALLIHAAKIDENYSEKEKKIIIEFTSMLTNSLKESDESIKNLSQEDTVNLVKKAEEFENNSNQILEYTKEVKKMDSDTKYLVLEFLWKIILSDDKSDVYESTLMRRICGLLYVPDKLSGEIKSNILKGKNI
tara:strand:+ start:2744 stop:3205 length:462 start_codon:yes stop_codon:yes gene_type:complete